MQINAILYIIATYLFSAVFSIAHRSIVKHLRSYLKDLDSHKFYIRQPSCEDLCFYVLFAFLELTALWSDFPAGYPLFQGVGVQRVLDMKKSF